MLFQVFVNQQEYAANEYLVPIYSFVVGFATIAFGYNVIKREERKNDRN